MVVFVFAALGPSWRIGTDPNMKGALITHGVYRYLRHPICTSFIIQFTGGFLVYATPYAAVMLVGAIPGVLRTIHREEKFLVAHYGDAYRAYMERAGRLFPRF